MSKEDKSNSAPDDAFFRILCGCAPVAMIATDADFNVVYCNSEAARLLGTSTEQLIGNSIYNAVPQNRHKLLARILDRTATKHQKNELELHVKDPSGTTRDLSIIFSPLISDEQNLLGFSAWVIDETHRKRLSERLLQAEKMASLGTLAGGVAHHFNNILGGIGTFVDYALTSGDEVAMKRALQMTTEAAARASKITKSLLSFAEKDEARRKDLADLTEVVLTFAHLVERPLSEKNITLDLELKPVPIIPVEASQMHQILGNLLTNSEEAMPEGGTVSIVIDHDESNVILTFADTGCGIHESHLPLVFEPFFTTKGLLSGGDKENPGLGLSVVHGIVLETGGNIKVESEQGKGTKFIITYSIPKESTG